VPLHPAELETSGAGWGGEVGKLDAALRRKTESCI